MREHPVCPVCGRDPVCCPCVVAGLSAQAEAISNYERWRANNSTEPKKEPKKKGVKRG